MSKLLTVALLTVLALASATPALAQSPGERDEEAISAASHYQYGESQGILSVADAARRAATHASDASEAFEGARAAGRAADDEGAAALAAEDVARDETVSEGGSAGAAPDKRLLETGGNAPLFLGCGVLLLGCGLVARRMLG